MTTWIIVASISCASVGAFYLGTLGLGSVRQRERLIRAAGWMTAAWAIAVLTAVYLIGGQP